MQATRRTAAEPRVGDEVAGRSRVLRRPDFVAYAGASGDLNPMHTDETAARAAGLPSVFGHGMLSAGFLGAAVGAYAGPGALRRYAVRFTRQLWPDTSVTTRVTVAGIRPGRLVDLDCALVTPDGTELVRGQATVAPDGRPAAAAPQAAVPSSADGGGDGGGLAGTRLADGVVVVERGPVARFAAAVGDDDPVYRSASAARAAGLTGVPVPPTFPFVVAQFGAWEELQPPSAGRPDVTDVLASLRGPGDLVLHGEQEFLYGPPILVGDVLDTFAVVESVAEKPTRSGGRSTVLTLRTDFHRRGDGAHVVCSRMTLLIRPPA